jgi:hypothetical protein
MAGLCPAISTGKETASLAEMAGESSPHAASLLTKNGPQSAPFGLP